MLPAATRLTVSDTYETARTENTRSCAATITIGSQKNGAKVPIAYEVIQTDDGQVMYRWDGSEFGKRAIATVMMSALSNVTRSPQETPAPEQTPTPRANSPSEIRANELAQLAYARMKAWKVHVYSTLSARAQELTEMPSGSQKVLFRIGPDGEITGVQAVGEEANAELAKKTVEFLQSTDRVSKPPEDEPVWIQMRFTFRG